VQAALKGVKGVTKVKVGKKTGTNADTTVTAGKDVKVADMVAALKKVGYGATEKKADS
jgi:copper chaperone CopZ